MLKNLLIDPYSKSLYFLAGIISDADIFSKGTTRRLLSLKIIRKFPQKYPQRN